MTMLTLSHTILSVGAGTRELGKGALLSENTAQNLGDILSSRVSAKDTDRRGELCEDHSSKALIDSEYLTARAHKVQPGIARIIIDKDNIVAMTPFGVKGGRSPHIGMDQVKRTLGYRRAGRIRQLNLFAQPAALTMQLR